MPAEPGPPTESPARRSNQSKVVQQLAAIDESLKVDRERRVVPWIKTAQAHTVFGLAIFANAVFIGIDVELGVDGFHWGLWIAESVFLLIFCTEISMRLWAERPNFRNYFDAWGIFDATITILGCVDTWIITVVAGGFGGDNPLGSLTLLRIFRLVRLVRLVRVLRMFSELVVLVQTIGSSIMAVAWMSLLLFLVIYTGSVATVLLIGHPKKAEDPEVDKYFGSLGTALFTHFCVVTLENWPDIARTAMRQSQWWAVYFVGVIIFTNFALVNLMVGVIVQRIILLSREQETELASFAAESDQFRTTLMTLFNSMELNFHNEVSTQDLRELLTRSETRDIMSAFGINLSVPPATLHTIMDLDHEGTMTFQEFFDACIRMCGSQQSVHSIFVQHDVCKCRHDLSLRMGRIEHLVGGLAQGTPTGPIPPAGLEAGVRELLARMEKLGRAQEQMLAELAEARALEGRCPAGAQASWSLGGDRSSEWPPADPWGLAETPRRASRASSARPSARRRSSAARSRAASAAPAGTGLRELLEHTGRELDGCCIARSARSTPRQQSPRPDLHAAKRRDLEAEYRSKRGSRS